jgi:hypothetical protein
MSDPLHPSEREKREAVFANETRAADTPDFSWSGDQYSADQYLVPEEDGPVVHQERLFSRRVLFGWAFATLIVVFAVTVILPMVAPIVKESVISSIVLQMKEQGMNVRVNGQPVEPIMPRIPDIPPGPAIAGNAPAVVGQPTSSAHPASPATALKPAEPAAPHHTKKSAPASTDRR